MICWIQLYWLLALVGQTLATFKQIYAIYVNKKVTIVPVWSYSYLYQPETRLDPCLQFGSKVPMVSVLPMEFV